MTCSWHVVVTMFCFSSCRCYIPIPSMFMSRISVMLTSCINLDHNCVISFFFVLLFVLFRRFYFFATLFSPSHFCHVFIIFQSLLFHHVAATCYFAQLSYMRCSTLVSFPPHGCHVLIVLLPPNYIISLYDFALAVLQP